MEVLPTTLPGLFRIRPKVFHDARGYFFEPYQDERYRAQGLDARFIMDGESLSKRGTVRGLHFRDPPETKLVRCVRGAIWDVAVDLRPDSPTFGKWEGFELSEDNHEQLYIPAGFGHGFSVLSDIAVMLYRKTATYDAKAEKGVRFDDPAIGVDWRAPIDNVSDRDRTNPTLAELLASGQLATR